MKSCPASAVARIFGADGVDGGCVDRAGSEEDEEDGGGRAGSVIECGPKKQTSAGGTARAALHGGDEVEGFGVLTATTSARCAAGDGSEQAGDDGDGSHKVGGVTIRAAVDALEEGGHPPGDAAERECDGGVAEDGGEIGLVLEEREDGSLLEFGFLVLAGSARGLLHEERHEDAR